MGIWDSKTERAYCSQCVPPLPMRRIKGMSEQEKGRMKGYNTNETMESENKEIP